MSERRPEVPTNGAHGLSPACSSLMIRRNALSRLAAPTTRRIIRSLSDNAALAKRAAGQGMSLRRTRASTSAIGVTDKKETASMDDDEIEPVPLLLQVSEPTVDPEAPQSGRWEVTTESGSRYLLDFDLGLLTRIRGTEQPDDPAVAFASKLRDHDLGAVKLLRVVWLRQNERAVFDIQSLSDNPTVAYTRRRTTYVREIRRLPDIDV